MNKESYTAASTFPAKLLHKEIIKKGKIIPVHIQLSPTNACNLKCKFCSCSDVDRKKSLSLKQITRVLDICSEKGTKAMTITGGGDPMLHPNINEIIRYASKKKINVGMVINGTMIGKLEYHKNLVWLRISDSDDRILPYQKISKALEVNPHTQRCFSYVITRNPNYENLKKLIDFANENNFLYIRLVSDLCDLENVPSMEQIKANLISKCVGKFDDSKVIYQGRKDSTRGNKKCYISLLKPVIAPEGIFPCCGVQYAIYGKPKTLVNETKMGEIEDLSDILDKQKYFDGSVCDVCYYQQYNEMLKQMLNKPDGVDFV